MKYLSRLVDWALHSIDIAACTIFDAVMWIAPVIVPLPLSVGVFVAIGGETWEAAFVALTTLSAGIGVTRMALTRSARRSLALFAVGIYCSAVSAIIIAEQALPTIMAGRWLSELHNIAPLLYPVAMFGSIIYGTRKS